MMIIEVEDTVEAMGSAAAQAGAAVIRKALDERGEASIIVATGTSQFEVLSRLVEGEGIVWDRVRGFHLDEYVGLPETHEASFRKYLRERFVSRLPVAMASFCYLDGEGDGAAECERAGELIGEHPVDVAFVGIGENGHLAFNDPPADFVTEEPYLMVELDEACRRQQLGEGWFSSFEEVPKRAISMSIRQIMKSGTIICSVPDERKAEAVMRAVQGPVTPEVPASILQEHGDCRLILDAAAASRLAGRR
jgi:glucosamine-6-phosphate deaminase